MRNIDLDGEDVQCFGAMDWDRGEHGKSPRRLPAWTRHQLPDFMDEVVRTPSGVHLEFVSDTETIDLGVLQTRLVVPAVPWPSPTYDLVVDDTLVDSRPCETGNVYTIDEEAPANSSITEGQETTLRFSGLPAKMKTCQIWLPTNAYVELRSLSIDSAAQIEAPSQSRHRWLHYGSSISHCVEAERPTDTWPVVAARLAGVDVVNLGFGGCCHMDQFVARTIGDEPADLISLKVGINIVGADTHRERAFAPTLHGFLDTVRDGHPRVPILAVSPIICPSLEDVPGPIVPIEENGKVKCRSIPGHENVRGGSLTLKRVREVIQGVVDMRRQQGDVNLHYLDGLELFGSEDVSDLPDELHPNAAGYVRMGERFHEKVFVGSGAFVT